MSALPQVATPWMTAEECAAYMCFKNLAVFYRWLATHDDFPRCRRGSRVLLFDRSVVDAYVRGDLRLKSRRRSADARINLVAHDRDSVCLPARQVKSTEVDGFASAGERNSR